MAHKTGPKTETPETMVRVTVTLDALTRRKLKVLGNGNESAGVRIAARVAYERYQRSDTGLAAAATTVAPPGGA